MTSLTELSEGIYRCDSIYHMMQNLDGVRDESHIIIPRVRCISKDSHSLTLKDMTGELEAKLNLYWRLYSNTRIGIGHTMEGVAVQYFIPDEFEFKGFQTLYKPPRAPSDKEKKTWKEVIEKLIPQPLGNPV